MTEVEHILDLECTKNAPYLVLMGEVFCEYFGAECFNGI